MSTFDLILPTVIKVFQRRQALIEPIKPLIINRDLNGRVRLIANWQWESSQVLQMVCVELHKQLGAHAYAPEHAVLFEEDVMTLLEGVTSFVPEGLEQIYVIDRLATEGDWANISPVSTGVPRIVFYSIKGGVGRSSALAVTAWSLAQSGKKVMVLDLDLESPGLSSALLPQERMPQYGITDWLVEDLVDNSDAVFESMYAFSDLSHDGEIIVIPAHGGDAGEYISKLGRVWMPKRCEGNTPEPWSKRLVHLLEELETRHRPDVVLIDSRSGIDEIASSCVTDLGAAWVLLFAIDGEQTFSGYDIVFQYWLQSDKARDIRERLRLVGAMIPETNASTYFQGLKERSWDLFSSKLYDEIAAGDVVTDEWSFDLDDEAAPHYPLTIRWHRGFAALSSMHTKLQSVDPQEVQMVFGNFIDALKSMISQSEGTHE